MLKKLALPVLAFSLAACDLPPPVQNVIDVSTLAAFKRAVPKKQNLTARLPDSAGGAGAAVGDLAQYPRWRCPTSSA